MVLIWCMPVFALQVQTRTFSTTNDLVVASGGAVPNAGTVTLRARALGGTTTKPSVVVSNEVLVLYNRNVPDSVASKDYYIRHRPGFSGANVLEMSPTTYSAGENAFEGITTNNLVNQIITPITNFVYAHPEKSIKYIVLMYGMPSRLTNTRQQPSSTPMSVQHAISRCLSGWNTMQDGPHGPYYDNTAFGKNPATAARFMPENHPGTSFLVTSLNMATLADCKAYIDKLSNMYTGDVIISAKNAGYHDDNYYIDEAQAQFRSPPWFDLTRDAILAVNPYAKVDYRSYTSPHISSGTNVAGYIGWGANGGLGGYYATNGAVVWSGDSGWWLCETAESFNGQRCNTYQASVKEWFLPNAWGGVNYSRTPVGAVSHVEEPSSGVNGQQYLGMWEAGYLFAECAWRSKRTWSFQAIGDPLIKR